MGEWRRKTVFGSCEERKKGRERERATRGSMASIDGDGDGDNQCQYRFADDASTEQ